MTTSDCLYEWVIRIAHSTDSFKTRLIQEPNKWWASTTESFIQSTDSKQQFIQELIANTGAAELLILIFFGKA